MATIASMDEGFGWRFIKATKRVVEKPMYQQPKKTNDYTSIYSVL